MDCLCGHKANRQGVDVYCDFCDTNAKSHKSLQENSKHKKDTLLRVRQNPGRMILLRVAILSKIKNLL